MQELISFFMSLGLTAEQASRMALDHVNPLSKENARGTHDEFVNILTQSGYDEKLANTIATNTMEHPMGSPYAAQLNEAIAAPAKRRDAYDRGQLEALAAQETRRLRRSADPDYLLMNQVGNKANEFKQTPDPHYDVEQDPSLADYFTRIDQRNAK